jgi:hypothetical protein
MCSKKVEVEVPDGYELIQNGLQINFVEQSGKWEDKGKISGYYVNNVSKVIGCVPFPRAEKHSNIFYKESQAVGSLNLARLSQQLADFNGDWKPDWGNGRAKYCISNEFTDGTILLKICLSYSWYRFLAFPNSEKAKLFLKENIKEIKLAKDFI